jgi:hypothetical protein
MRLQEANFLELLKRGSRAANLGVASMARTMARAPACSSQRGKKTAAVPFLYDEH